MQRRFGSDWNTIKEPYRTLFVNEWLKSGTTIVLDELFKGFSSNLNIRYNANVGMGLHILAKLN